MFKAAAYTLPLSTVYRWAKGSHDSRSGVILSCRIGDHTGWGEVAFGPHVEINHDQTICELMDFVHGLDPEKDEFVERLDLRDMHNRVRCAIVTAWLSARAAAAGKPLNRYLAGDDAAPPMQIPINGLIGEQDVAAAVTQGAGYAAQGMTTFKIKCFPDFDHDVERVRALRDAFPDFAFRLDPNDAWKSVEDACRNMERMAAFGIDYVEDPLDTLNTSIEAMSEVKRQGAIRTAWDNSVNNADDMQRLVDAEAADLFILKMPRSGGPDRFLDMVALATAAGIACVNTGPLETAIGTLAGLHVTSLMPQPLAHSGFSLSGHYARDLAAVPPVIDGYRTIPDHPGLGVEPGEDFISAMTDPTSPATCRSPNENRAAESQPLSMI